MNQICVPWANSHSESTDESAFSTSWCTGLLCGVNLYMAKSRSSVLGDLSVHIPELQILKTSLRILVNSIPRHGLLTQSKARPGISNSWLWVLYLKGFVRAERPEFWYCHQLVLSPWKRQSSVKWGVAWDGWFANSSNNTEIFQNLSGILWKFS